MCEVVEHGTAHNIQSGNYSIAGKTGTAQTNYHRYKVRSGIRHQAGFCGFFPADNPQYSCIVVINEPQQGGYHGAEAAAPVFREIADRCFAIKPGMKKAVNAEPPIPLGPRALPGYQAGLSSDLEKSMRWLDIDWYKPENPSEWAMLRPQSDSLMLINRIVPDQTVPSVAGMGLKDAIYILENRGCKVKVRGYGKVRRQSLAPGTRARGTTCVLYLE